MTATALAPVPTDTTLHVRSAYTAVIGEVEFPFTEAAYVHAHAGMCLSGNAPGGVGITDKNGGRWLLSAPSTRRIEVQRFEVTLRLRPAQVKQAFEAFSRAHPRGRK